MECAQCGSFVSHKECIPVFNEWDASHPVLCSIQCLEILKEEVGAEYIHEED